MLLPFSIKAAFVGDYTKGRFTLGGSLGVNHEDYSRSLNGSEFSRRELEKEAAVDMTGFVWDPRFLSFSTGVTLTEADTATSGGDIDRETVGYHLNTTWFANRDHPLNIFASRQTNTVAQFDSPSYDLSTERYGLRWGFQGKMLGNVRMNFEVLDAESDNSELVERDETREIIEFEGKRRINRESGSSSDITYGFREIDSEDHVYGTVAQQRNWYAYDRTDFDETTSLISSVRYYDREDVWPGSDGGALQQFESSFFNANSSVRIQSSEVLRQFYSVALSQSESTVSESTRYDMRGGIVYNFAPNWELQTNAGLNGGNYESEAVEGDDLFAQFETGLRYNRHFESIDLRGGYSAAYDAELESSDSEGRENTVAHTANFGLSRRVSAWWEDAVDYRVRIEQGGQSSREHNVQYFATSSISPVDHVRVTVDWRRYQADRLWIEQDTTNVRYKIDWNHRFGPGNAFSLGAGYTTTETDESMLERSFVQGRLGLSPRRLRRLRFNALLHIERENRQTAADADRTSMRAETNVVYPFGRWETSAVYRYRGYDDENPEFASSFDEQSIMLYLRRNFGMRF